MHDRTTIIRAGRLIDGTATGSLELDQALFVDSGTITRVAPAGELSPGAEAIDLSSSTVLPGLIDCHVHLIFSASQYALGDVLVEDDQQLLLRGVAASRQALRAGITTVRDLGGRGGVTFRLRDAIAKGQIAGPRVLAAGSPIDLQPKSPRSAPFITVPISAMAAPSRAVSKRRDWNGFSLLMATGNSTTRPIS